MLDAYSGSGALGVEALSRGAAFGVFVESDPAAVATLRQTCLRLGLVERCRVVSARVLDWLQEAAEPPFDLVLADPPYRAGEIRSFLERIGGRLSRSGRVVIEREARTESVESAGSAFPLQRVRSERYGRACLDFYHPTA